MTPLARRVQRTYLALVVGNTLAAAFIWGINTLFLLDAGLSNVEAFAANAFFTAGMVLFEVPTGVVADSRGRRASYLLGTVTLAASTALYWGLWRVEGPFWAWAVVSVLLGLGFTFFSGAVEAWLVDALRATGYAGELEPVFARGQVAGGVAMLVGSVAGGALAQVTDLGVPFLLRAGVLLVMLVVAAVFMRDLGFTPAAHARPGEAVRAILTQSLQHGLGNPPVRWLMLAAPFVSGVGVYAFYAMQPFLLDLYGDPDAYAVAGLAAAVIAGSQILGGTLATRVRRLVHRRTTVLLAGTAAGAGALALLGVVDGFGLALALLVLWGVAGAAVTPVRQAYLNDLVPSAQRATVLSFDSLVGSAGGVVVQPALGRAADVWGYGPTYLVGAAVNLLALPFLVASRRRRSPADVGGG
ncbi:MFS transporter [Cellulomonas cellasea]|uniref:MFS family permease n=1 Tax=Cellulomonas cellasea TaxID=43670 RepID=A0A7W4UDF7_9CELL|nr:MFS transporter [Cellulomonas cellasea]MBB2922124.1 MFS family permease [Cellulomonas cellasea]